MVNRMNNLYDESETAAMTMKQFMQWAQISHAKAYKEIKAGKLTAVKAGRRTLIKRKDAEAWLDNLPEIGGAS